MRAAIETALVLGPAGEFAFVILTTGMVEGIAARGFTQGVLVSATLSMFTVPLMAMLGQRLARVALPGPATVSVRRDGAWTHVDVAAPGTTLGGRSSGFEVGVRHFF
jgi:hypothetical protein